MAMLIRPMILSMNRRLRQAILRAITNRVRSLTTSPVSLVIAKRGKQPVSVVASGVERKRSETLKLSGKAALMVIVAVTVAVVEEGVMGGAEVATAVATVLVAEVVSEVVVLRIPPGF